MRPVQHLTKRRLSGPASLAGIAAIGGSALVLFVAPPALADPCTASLPKRGQTFSGLVRYVGDGDGLCVGRTADPATWVEVRLADFYAPELREPGGQAAKRSLERLTTGKRAVCVARNRSYDRIVASCTVAGTDVAALLRRAGVREGGNGR